MKYVELSEEEEKEVPDYAFDCHTAKGRSKGKTKKDFWVEEYNKLKNKQVGFFDEYVK